MNWIGKCHDCGLVIPHLFWVLHATTKKKYWICESCIKAWRCHVEILLLANCNQETGRMSVVDAYGFELTAENVFIGGVPF